MGLVVWFVVLAPAVWAGLLLARIFQGILAFVLPALLSPHQLLMMDDYTIAFAVFGIVLCVIGNFMIGLETGFLRWKKLWLDNALVYLGVAAWLVAALLEAEWWLPLAGQGIAALMLAPQLCLMIARMTIRGDAFFAALTKLLALTLALLVITEIVGWLGL